MEITDIVQQYAAEQQKNSSLTEATTENTSVNQEQAAVPTAQDVPAEQLRQVDEAQASQPIESIAEQELTEEEVLDEEDFIKQRTEGMYSSWDELQAALQEQQTKQIKFENETSEILYNLIAEGKINEVADILYNKKIADEIKTKPDEEVLKSYIKFQNPEFDNDDIEAEYQEKYSIDEFAFDESKLKREQKKLNQKVKNDVSEARQFFESMSEEIKFPQYTQQQQVEPQEDTEAQEERQKFLDSLNGVESRIGSIPFNWKDDKASLSINGKFEIPAQEASKYREAAESLQDYYGERYYQDGKYNSERLLKDLYIADNFEKIVQSVISQTANQTRLEMLKQRKNITTDTEQQGTYRPSAADEEKSLLDKLFMGHRKQNQY